MISIQFILKKTVHNPWFTAQRYPNDKITKKRQTNMRYIGRSYTD